MQAPQPRMLRIPATQDPKPFYVRDQLVKLFGCSHGELGRLMCRKMLPMPIRHEEVILWHVDEVQSAYARVAETLSRWQR